MALHPLWRMWCKLQVKTPSEYTYSLVWAELSVHPTKYRHCLNQLLVPYCTVSNAANNANWDNIPLLLQRIQYMATTSTHQSLNYYNYDLWLQILSAIQLLHWSLVGICVTYTFLPNCSSAEHTVPNYELHHLCWNQSTQTSLAPSKVSHIMQHSSTKWLEVFI